MGVINYNPDSKELLSGGRHCLYFGSGYDALVQLHPVYSHAATGNDPEGRTRKGAVVTAGLSGTSTQLRSRA
jgi:hypothetical protein